MELLNKYYAILNGTQYHDYTFYSCVFDVYRKEILSKNFIIIFWKLTDDKKELLNKLIGHDIVKMQEDEKENNIIDRFRKYVNNKYREV